MNGMILLAAALSAGLPKLEFAEWGAVPADVEMTVRKEAGREGRPRHARRRLVR